MHAALFALTQALEKAAEDAYAVLQTLHLSQRCLGQHRAGLRVVMCKRAHAFLDVWREELNDAALGETGDVVGAAEAERMCKFWQERGRTRLRSVSPMASARRLMTACALCFSGPEACLRRASKLGRLRLPLGAAAALLPKLLLCILSTASSLFALPFTQQALALLAHALQ
jgi:hypothetical protein